MKFNLKGGVLIIGSLFWQDHRDNTGDNLRKSWRDTYLDMSSASNVDVPIRYKRFSKDNAYTMVFDNTLEHKNFGVAKAIKFKKNGFANFEEISDSVKLLSNIEGKYCSNFIKGKKNKTVAWCVCTILFNPQTISPGQKTYMLKEWGNELKVNEVGYNKFILAPELYSLKKTGELDIPWPKGIEHIDFLIATSTMPLPREGVKEVTSEEIAHHLRNREYFYPNVRHGIKTFQDDEIIKLDSGYS